METILEAISHPVVAVLLLLGILVFVHELGHYLVGRWSGIAAEIFSIGVGPVIFRVKRGLTEYRLSIIPLGGFVKFYGAAPDEEVPAEVGSKAFCRASLRGRFATIAAGPLANFMLAVCCYTIMGFHGIEHPPPLVGEIIPGGAAAQSQLEYDDLVKKIDGRDISTWQELHDAIYFAPAKTLALTVLRDGQLKTIQVKTDKVDPESDSLEPYGRIGISPGRMPSVVTLEGIESEAAKTGYQTGDHIMALKLPGQSNLVEISFWRELTRELKNANQAGIDQVTAVIERHQDSLDKPIKLELALPTGALMASSQFGLIDSQFTIEKVGSFPDQDLLKPGDRILGFGGKRFSNIFDYAEAIGSNSDETLSFEINRGGEILNLALKLKPVDIQKVDGKKTVYILPTEFMGQLVSSKPVIESYGFLGAVGYGFSETGKKSAMIGGAILKLFTGDMPLKALGGPISIAKVASDSIKLGWMTFLASMSLISINLGLLNLVPIPVLDGGQLCLLAMEGVRRKPLSQLTIENFQKVGFVMILSLVVMATYNDLSRFWLSMLKGVSGYFE